MALPVLHVPPALERLDGIEVVQAGDVVDGDRALAEGPLEPGGFGSIGIRVIGRRRGDAVSRRGSQ